MQKYRVNDQRLVSLLLVTMSAYSKSLTEYSCRILDAHDLPRDPKIFCRDLDAPIGDGDVVVVREEVCEQVFSAGLESLKRIVVPAAGTGA